jgi:hypothetical protein
VAQSPAFTRYVGAPAEPRDAAVAMEAPTDDLRRQMEGSMTLARLYPVAKPGSGASRAMRRMSSGVSRASIGRPIPGVATCVHPKTR